MSEPFDMIAKTFFGLENTLAEELQAAGALDVRTGRRMCSFRGDLATMYRANIQCRTAVRILKPIHRFTAADEKALYEGIGGVDWLALLDSEGSLAIDPVVHSPVFSNSLYAAQLTKDAVVDQIRAATGRRPSVDLADPELRINLHIDREQVTVYLDSSGDSLHKRGYRVAAGEAPMNEVLAAGILRLGGWDQDSPLADFMCGSGTLLIEAALAARHIGPGLVRGQFAFQRWKDFCSATYDAAIAAARLAVLPNLSFPIRGSDLDPRAIDAARQNARRAGVDKDIEWVVENFESVAPPATSGTLVVNPPYDERMKVASIEAVYRRLGDVLKRNWAGYRALVFTGNLEAAKHIGLRTSAKTRLFNGAIECRLLAFDLFASKVEPTEASPRQIGQDLEQAFANRLRRMAKHWHRSFRRQNISAYRVYDRDVPDVPLAIDWYDGHVLITEYERPHSRTEIENRAWLDRMVALVGATLAVPDERVIVRSRLAKTTVAKGPKEKARVVEVREGPLMFETHLSANQETGLALDRRTVRGMLWTDAPGRRFLNLFAKSGWATVAAAAGEAISSLSVEASPALAEWAKRNLRLNGISPTEHRVECMSPLEFAAQLDPAAGPQFDLAYVEPPAFDGKRREGVWNVQDGHVDLLNRVLACMSVGGMIYFSTTFRRLKLHNDRLRRGVAREITRQTTPPDFRDSKVHRCWAIVHTES